MSKTTRHDFTERTKQQIALRVGYRCSDPNCRIGTIGASSDGNSVINVGVAAHICAASSGGPRYDPNMSEDERRSATNGIWLCQVHAKAIDSKDPKYTVELLRSWKEQAQTEARELALYGVPRKQRTERLEAQSDERFVECVRSDLDAYRRTDTWPVSDVDLKLSLANDNIAITTSKLAAGLSSIGDLVIVADPGLGKTSALYQIADACVRDEGPLPLFVSLPDWALQQDALFAYLLKRSAFQNINLNQLREAIRRTSSILLLDGWNELDALGRRRARRQLATLQSELPELGLIVATRRQRTDVPINAITANVLPLDWKQQRAIGEALRGQHGRQLVDRATRQAGIRELVGIPLYLRAVLALPDGSSFPSTKEALLGQFARAHERDLDNSDALMEVLQTVADPYLLALALRMTRDRVSVLGEPECRAIVSSVSRELFELGQIASSPEPRSVLDVLVNHHLLIRSEGSTGYAFQHQQFQEWYASFSVSAAIIAAQGSNEARRSLQFDFLDRFEWEEPLFFACERLASSDDGNARASSTAILAALEVDPLLAAEMIRRSSETAWSEVREQVVDFLKRWHTHGNTDRAFRAMMVTGRPDFVVQTWPLLSNDDDQVHLAALRQSGPLVLSSFGPDASEKISNLPKKVRRNVLHEIAMYGDFEAIEFATEMAIAEADPAIVAWIIGALEFRGAEDQIERVLQDAEREVYDQTVQTRFTLRTNNSPINEKLDAARARLGAAKDTTIDRIYALVASSASDDRSEDARRLILDLDMSEINDGALRIIYELSNRYPHAVANGLLDRLLSGRGVFWRASEIMASVSLLSDDARLLEIALTAKSNRVIAETAASVLGTKSTAALIGMLDDVHNKIRRQTGKRDPTLTDHRLFLERRIAHVPGASLIEAISERAQNASCSTLSNYAHLITRHVQDDEIKRRGFSQQDQRRIGHLFQDWSERAMSDPELSRNELGEIAGLVRRAPNDDHLDRLRKMLDTNLSRYRETRAIAEKAKWRRGYYPSDAHHPQLHQYQWSFSAIDTPASRSLVQDYLVDPDFGECAARILLQSWKDRNEPRDSLWMPSGLDVELLKARRASLIEDPTLRCDEAERMFQVIDQCLSDGTDADVKHAVMLTPIAVLFPHNGKREIVDRVLQHAPRSAKASILEGLLLSGHRVETSTIIDGIEALLIEAEEKTYLLHESEGFALRQWLNLIPFSTAPETALETIIDLPERCQTPRRLKNLIMGLGESPEPDAETLLFSIAQRKPDLYSSGIWQRAAFEQPSKQAGIWLLDLVMAKQLSTDTRPFPDIEEYLSGVFIAHPDLRTLALNSIQNNADAPGCDCVLRALALRPDIDTLRLLLKHERASGESFVSWRGIELMVTKAVPSDTWRGALRILPVSVPGLRAMLIQAIDKGDKDDLAASILKRLERTWDDAGWPDTERRHPDLESGKPWPMLLE